MDAGFTTNSFDFELDTKVRVRGKRSSLVGPFDQADAVAFEVFVQACIEEFLWIDQPIKIKVIQV